MEKVGQKNETLEELEGIFSEVLGERHERIFSLGLRNQGLQTKYIKDLDTFEKGTIEHGFRFAPKVVGSRGNIEIGTGYQVVEVLDPEKFIAYINRIAKDKSTHAYACELIDRLGNSFVIWWRGMLKSKVDFNPKKPFIRPQDKKAFMALKDIPSGTSLAEGVRDIAGILTELPEEKATKALALLGFALNDLQECLGLFAKEPSIENQSYIIKEIKPWFIEFYKFTAVSPTAAKIFKRMKFRYNHALSNAQEKLENDVDAISGIKREILKFVDRELGLIKQA